MTTTNDAGTLREKIIGLVIDVYQSGYYFGSIGERDARNPYTTPEDTAREILAAVAEAMLSEDVLEELNSAVELETINVHSGEFRVNAHEMMNAALNMAGITERERE